MGESPTRPGSLPVRPPVETATAMRPSASRATAPTVSAPSSSCCRLRSVMKSGGSSSMRRTAATTAASAPAPMRAQPSSRERSTAAWRSPRSFSGMEPAPPWTIRAGRAKWSGGGLVGQRFGLGPKPAPLDEAALGDAALEGRDDPPVGGGPLRAAALAKPPLHADPPIGLTTLRAAFHLLALDHFHRPLLRSADASAPCDR